MHVKYLRSSIIEFDRLIEFIKNEQPILSAKLGVFGKKDSFELNSMLVNPKVVTAPNYNQEQFPVIDLMFNLALLGGLFYKGNNEKGKPALIETPKLESYLALNDSEKYVFLLQTYWTKYEFEEKFDRFIMITEFYYFLARIANSEPNERILSDGYFQVNYMFSTGAAFIHHLRFFDLGELELVEGVTSKYEDSIKAFIPNDFGIAIADFLCTDALKFWNREDLVYLSILDDSLKLDIEGEPFEAFRNLFPKNAVTHTVPEIVGDELFGGVYHFKVSLSKTLWRKIKISSKDTFGNLHTAIQRAFEFDDDHLYAFYINGNRRTGKPIYCGYAQEGGPVAEETTFEDVGLFKGQKLSYLFDFGDMWEFNLELIEIDKEEPLPLHPIITEVKGESPEQYDWIE